MSTLRKGATSTSSKQGGELRRGSWTLEEDNLLTHYISCHGEGRWNLLAIRSGLRRTGKSCRLRWMNYLKPDVKHGNLSLEEQVLILELHSKLGNRWSKIAQCLPGRTDNEIKNYWRTRVLKQARNLRIDANSTAFQDVLRRFWIPRLLQKIETPCSSSSPPNLALPPPPTQSLKLETYNMNGTPFHGSNHHQKSSIVSSGNCTSPSICSSRTINECSYQVSEYPIYPFCVSANNDYYCLNNGVSDMGTFSLGSMLEEPLGAGQVDDNSWVDNSLIDCLWNVDEL